jgi:peptidoglycan/xylan/chitin deacetylase (PgdA/CDA1 family)
MPRLTDTPFKLLAGQLSPAGKQARLSILIFHRVLPQPDPLFPSETTVETFDNQLAQLKSVFNILALPEAVERLKDNTLPARPACITFDDGYADNVTNALPLLKRHGLHATFFIATDYLNGGRMFNDTVIEAVRLSPLEQLDLNDLGLGTHTLESFEARTTTIGHILSKVKYLPLQQRDDTVNEIARRAEAGKLPDDLMMTTEHLIALHDAGMEIGGHTHRHPILARLNDDQIREEIVAGRTWLEDALGQRIKLFAYPNGKPGTDYLPEQAKIIRELGFDAAVSTEPGVSTSRTDPFQLHRFTPWSSRRLRFLPMLINNLRHT